MKSRYDRNILQNAINKDNYIKELKIINDWISKLTTYANDYSFTAEKRENSISFIKSLQDKRYELKANFTMFQAITSVLSKQIKDLKTLFMEHILSKNRGEKEIIIQKFTKLDSLIENNNVTEKDATGNQVSMTDATKKSDLKTSDQYDRISSMKFSQFVFIFLPR